jgi:lysine-specific histone demethylase 1
MGATSNLSTFAEYVNNYQVIHQANAAPYSLGLTAAKTVTAFSSGSLANAASSLSDSALTSLVGGQMSLMFPGLPAPSRALMARWDKDPFAFGSYSYNALGMSLSDRNAFLSPTATGSAALLFCGEHANGSTAYFATVHGAWGTGLNAGRKVAPVAMSPSHSPSPLPPKTSPPLPKKPSPPSA